MALVGALAVAISLYFFRVQIDSLYRQDFAGRIRGIEFEYAEVDAVSAASDEVGALQNDLLTQLGRRFAGEEGARPFIINGDGQIILWPDDTGLQRDVSAGLLDHAGDTGELSVTLPTGQGPTWFFAQYYPAWDWYTGYTVPEAERFSPFQRFLRILVAAILLAAIIAFGLYSLTLRRLLRPLHLVQAALEEYRGGDLRGRVAATRRDEIGRIGTGINEFADRLTEIIERIRASSETNVAIESRLSGTSREAVDGIQRISTSTEDISAQVERLDSLVDRSDASVNRIDAEIHRLLERIEDRWPPSPSLPRVSRR
jgi:methyl-accepting chemotaxis protein